MTRDEIMALEGDELNAAVKDHLNRNAGDVANDLDEAWLTAEGMCENGGIDIDMGRRLDWGGQLDGYWADVSGCYAEDNDLPSVALCRAALLYHFRQDEEIENEDSV